MTLGEFYEKSNGRAVIYGAAGYWTIKSEVVYIPYKKMKKMKLLTYKH